MLRSAGVHEPHRRCWLSTHRTLAGLTADDAGRPAEPADAVDETDAEDPGGDKA